MLVLVVLPMTHLTLSRNLLYFELDEGRLLVASASACRDQRSGPSLRECVGISENQSLHYRTHNTDCRTQNYKCLDIFNNIIA